MFYKITVSSRVVYGKSFFMSGSGDRIRWFKTDDLAEAAARKWLDEAIKWKENRFAPREDRIVSGHAIIRPMFGRRKKERAFAIAQNQ